MTRIDISEGDGFIASGNGRMFQDKIKREKPPHHDAPVSFSPVADVLDSKRPIDPLA